MEPSELEKLLRDSFANYVVQTAMDYADDETKARLIGNIRPILPLIRHTPYGRRIQVKIQDYDTRLMSESAGTTFASGQQLANVAFSHSGGTNALTGFSNPNSGFSNANTYGAVMGSPNGHRGLGTGSLNALSQHPQAGGFNQGFAPLGRGPRATGVSNVY